jgi:hypothetical protein
MAGIQLPWRYRLPMLLGIADVLWSLSALRPSPGANAAASVGMINTVIWIFLHLPAALAASLPFGVPATPGLALPSLEIVLMAALGVLQMAALGWGLGSWMDRRGKA